MKGNFADIGAVRLANVVVVCVDEVELVAVPDVGFSRTCYLNSEEDLEEVRGRVTP